jgi:ATP-dependent DNA ligase
MIAAMAENAFVAKGMDADMLLRMEVFRVQFIPPALVKLRSSPPASDAWLFELKFDG